MQTGYFNAAWQDIKNSPGWFGKLVILSLVSLIPIFGWIVVGGYVYGWARDIAWNVHSPLPAHIFGNEDGKLYSRGFFVVVIGIVCALIPWAIEMVWAVVTGAGSYALGGSHGGFFAFFGLSSLVFSLFSLAAGLFAILFTWVGSMRMSVYGRLAPGLQFGKIWAMIRHDFSGLLRILGMYILLWIGASIAMFVLFMVLLFIGMIVGFAVTGGNMNINSSHPDGVIWAMIASISGVVVLLMIVYGVLAMAMSTFISAMTVRAMGYWTRQFEVHAWRGQDDPMPFEIRSAAGGQPGQQPPFVPPPGQPPMQG